MSEKEIVTVDLFSDEERQIVNQLSEGTGYSASRDEICKAAVSLRQLMDEDDTEYVALADALCSKLNSISDTEWEDLRGYLPFPVNIAATHDYMDDEVPDVDD